MIDIEHRLTTVEDVTKSNERRINELEKRQDNLDELVSTVKVLAVREETVENDIKEIKADVKTMAGKSGKRWDGLVDKVILTVAAALIGFLLSQIGI